MIDKKLLLDEKRKYGLDQTVSNDELIMLENDVPIQKIIGYIEMANVKIDISKKVLIPRYETEELILIAINLIKKHNIINVLDLCCGSGFIGIALKKEFTKNINLYLSDIDPEAIEQTNINLKLNSIDANIIQSNMFEKIKCKFDLIVCNPPYLLEEEKNTMSKSVLDYEPHHALFASEHGLYYYNEIEKNVSFINDGGFLLLEINPINANWFKNKNYQVIKDINGKERFAYKQIIYSMNE